jgi:hypothetical protein
MPLYATGHNQPGYLPDDDGTNRLVTRDWQCARDSLVEDLRDTAAATQTWADPHDCDDIPCPTYGDDCPDNLAADLRMAAEELAALQPDTPWQATVAGQAWRLDDLGDHCPNCGYPLAQHGCPAAHQRPADGHTCELEFDDDGTLTA